MSWLKNAQFHIIAYCSTHNATEVDSDPNSVNNGAVKPKYKANSWEVIHEHAVRIMRMTPLWTWHNALSLMTYFSRRSCW